MLAFLPVLLTHLVHCFDDQACFQEAVFIQHRIGVYRPQFRSQLWSVKTLPPETLWVKLPVESGMPQDLFGPRFTDTRTYFRYQAIDLRL